MGKNKKITKPSILLRKRIAEFKRSNPKDQINRKPTSVFFTMGGFNDMINEMVKHNKV